MRHRNFVIIGTQRTGSSLLAERIGMHPEIGCGWEWTERVAWPRKLQAMERGLDADFSLLPESSRAHMHKVLNERTAWLGFRRLFGASDRWVVHPRYSLKLLADRFDAHLRWFQRHPAVHLIHIVREDNIGWLKSKYVARSTGSFIGKPYPETLQIHVPIEDALARVRSKHWIDARLGSLADTNPYHRVVYESLTQDLDQQAAGVFGFLGCSEAPTECTPLRTQRQSSKPDREYISNYDRLSEALHRHGFC